VAAWGGTSVSVYGNFLPDLCRSHGKKVSIAVQGGRRRGQIRHRSAHCCVVVARLTGIGSAASQYAIMRPIVASQGADCPGAA
jgi:hypothetical protein